MNREEEAMPCGITDKGTVAMQLFAHTRDLEAIRLSETELVVLIDRLVFECGEGVNDAPSVEDVIKASKLVRP